MIWALFASLIFSAWPAPLQIVAYSSEHPGLEPRSVHLDATIEGKIRRFSVDTGANMTSVILDEQAQSFAVIGQAVSRAVSSVNTCKTLLARSWQIANLKLGSLNVYGCDSRGLDNLGMDAFDGRVVSFDFTRSQLDFLQRQPEGIPYFPMRKARDNRRFLPFAVEGVPLSGMFDTGAAMTSVDQAFVTLHPELFEPVGRGVSRDTYGATFGTAMYRVRSLKIGTLRLRDVYVQVFDFGQLREDFGGAPVILGNNVIMRADWIFNFANDQWTNTPHRP